MKVGEQDGGATVNGVENGRKEEENQQKKQNKIEWENWRERRRQEWMEGGLAGTSRGMHPDHCKEGGVGQVSHQLQP